MGTMIFAQFLFLDLIFKPLLLRNIPDFDALDPELRDHQDDEEGQRPPQQDRGKPEVREDVN